MVVSLERRIDECKLEKFRKCLTLRVAYSQDGKPRRTDLIKINGSPQEYTYLGGSNGNTMQVTIADEWATTKFTLSAYFRASSEGTRLMKEFEQFLKRNLNNQMSLVYGRRFSTGSLLRVWHMARSGQDMAILWPRKMYGPSQMMEVLSRETFDLYLSAIPSGGQPLMEIFENPLKHR
ncbi:hypothetical protein HYX10_04760 [Candidatus Woesearchaeota archaeon]|nr:hypothetical protein [Candidatus Woesearchaeota archaeon]